MKFEIFGDSIKVKSVLEEFVNMAKTEYEKQTKSGLLKAIHFPVLEFVISDNGNSITLADSIPSPPLFLKNKAVDKAKKNLEGYLQEKGCKIEKIEYRGD